MRKALWLLLFVLALPLSQGGSVLADDPSDGHVEIQNVIYNGSGCPAGTAQVTIADDKQSFSIVFNQFVALAGPGITLPQSRRNCIVNITAKVTDGFTWGVGEADFRGSTQIAAGTTGIHTNLYFFQGQAQQLMTFHPFAATAPSPIGQAWTDSDVFDPEDVLFAPCGVQRSLNINAAVRVTPGGATNPGSFLLLREEQVVQLVVQKCP
jgi:hypothetical protein